MAVPVKQNILKTRPMFSTNNIIYLFYGHIEFFSKMFGVRSLWRESFKVFPYEFNIFFTNFCHSMTLSFATVVSFLFHHVINVILLCAKKKMVWINTPSIIAFMQNKNIFMDIPNMDLIRKSMCSNGFIVKAKSSISIMSYRSIPYPTTLSFIEESKEIFCCIFRHHMKKVIYQ